MPQIIVIPYDGQEIGQGYNSETRESIGTGLVVDNTLEDADANGQHRNALNGLMAHAIRVSTGKMEPPQLFVANPAPAALNFKKKPMDPADPVTKKYVALGGEQNSLLGASSDLMTLTSSDGKGRFRRWHNGGIFWHPDAGPQAFIVHGRFYDAYKAFGEHDGKMGWPLTDSPVADGNNQEFEHAEVFGMPMEKWPQFSDGNMFGVCVVIPNITGPAAFQQGLDLIRLRNLGRLPF